MIISQRNLSREEGALVVCIMIMIMKPLPPCPLCLVDSRLKDIKDMLTNKQKKAYSVWIASEKGLVFRHVLDEPVWTRVLFNQGKPTTLPTFDSYSDLWNTALIPNPFLFDWNTFDVHDEFDHDFLKVVCDTLDEQLPLWCPGAFSGEEAISDEATSEHPVFDAVCTFSFELDRLLSYTNVSRNGL